MRNPRIELEEASFDLEDTISVSEAMKYTGATRPTVIGWAQKYHIGIQLGGKNCTWRIYPDKLKLLMQGALKGGSRYQQ